MYKNLAFLLYIYWKYILKNHWIFSFVPKMKKLGQIQFDQIQFEYGHWFPNLRLDLGAKEFGCWGQEVHFQRKENFIWSTISQLL